jgi:hypothetical protein
VHIEYSLRLDMPHIERKQRAIIQAEPWRKRVSYLCIGATVAIFAVDLFVLGFPSSWVALAMILISQMGLQIYAKPSIAAQGLANVASAEPTVVTITDTELIAESSVQRTSVRWSGIESVTDGEDIWVCRSAGSAARFVIYRDLLVPERLTELQAFLVTRGLLPSASSIKI